MAKEITTLMGWLKGTRHIAVWGLEETWEKLWQEELERPIMPRCTK
jgi:hypothetical protein